VVGQQAAAQSAQYGCLGRAVAAVPDLPCRFRRFLAVLAAYPEAIPGSSTESSGASPHPSNSESWAAPCSLELLAFPELIQHALILPQPRKLLQLAWKVHLGFCAKT